MAFELKIHPDAVHQISLLSKDDKELIFAQLRAIAQLNRARDQGYQLPLLDAHGYKFWAYATSDFRIECALPATPPWIVVVLRIGYRSCKFFGTEYIVVGSFPQYHEGLEKLCPSSHGQD